MREMAEEQWIWQLATHTMRIGLLQVPAAAKLHFQQGQLQGKMHRMQ
jgi:hypothetical protein